MKVLLKLLGALAGALLAVFYLGSLVGESLLATRSFESSQDVMFQHSMIYLATIVVCVIIGWIVGAIIGAIFGAGD